MAPAELVILPPSPWSLKARWAVVLSSFPVTITIYTGTSQAQLWAMRLRLWRWRFTTPIMFPSSGPALTDSLDIAAYADAYGSTPGALFPQGSMPDIKKWNAMSNAFCIYARAELFAALTGSSAARARIMPKPLKKLGWLGDWLLKSALLGLTAKYAKDTASTSLEACLDHLKEIQATLRRAGGGAIKPGTYLLGGTSITYADITVAVGLCAMDLLPAPYSATCPTLASGGAPKLAARVDEFADLLQWRADILAKHFPTDALLAQLPRKKRTA